MLKIPRTVDYGVLILLVLYEEGAAGPLSAADIARRANLPGPQVAKLLKTLQRQGLVESVRGPKGGYGLAEKGSQINLAGIYRALEGPLGLTDCLSLESCDCRALAQCRLRSHLAVINERLASAFQAITLSSISHGKAANGLAAGAPV